MKIVRFNRDMAPQHCGDERVLPDAVAAKLVTDGDATLVGDFPPKPAGQPSGAPAPAAKPRRREQSYLTK
jgi:hypothetical protein